MAHVSTPQRPRRVMAFALLATTAAAALLGGCTQSGSPFARLSGEPKLAAADEIGAVTQWSQAYAKKPQDPKMALGYAAALKAIGSRDRALEVLTDSYRANPQNGEVASELGRLALDLGRLDIATQTLKVAEAQGVRDWKTLSAQGTLRAKEGQHAEAQQYFLAALKEQPDAVSVINNLALSYALDGKADKSEALLRKAVASGHDDKRVRQNLALVLGLEGKFDEARQVASVDMTAQEAQSSMSYLRNMLSSPTQFAAAKPGGQRDDWEPFASNEDDEVAAPAKTAEAATAAATPKVRMVQASEEIEAPKVPHAPAAKPTAPQTAPAAAGKTQRVAGTPQLITPVNATPAQAKAAGLLRADTD
jgi:Flp pilus assembly protein TadD